MPNHVTNIITARKEVIDSLAGENGLVDFETVLPTPKDMLKGNISSEEMAANPNNWYTVQIDRWGTKWNAYGIERNSDTEIEFETAWSHPLPVIKALTEKFPEDVISVKYADEDLGSNFGQYTAKNGEFVQQEDFSSLSDDEAMDWAGNLIHGADWEELKREWYEDEED